MSATVTFILGLCGSGKTHLIERLPADLKFDEGFLWNLANEHERLIAALASGKDCIAIEIEYCRQSHREEIVDYIRKAVPNVKIKWLCFENSLAKANKNCRERTDKPDPERHVVINQLLSPDYTYPDGAEIRPIWTQE